MEKNIILGICWLDYEGQTKVVAYQSPSTLYLYLTVKQVYGVVERNMNIENEAHIVLLYTRGLSGPLFSPLSLSPIRSFYEFGIGPRCSCSGYPLEEGDL